MKRHLCILLAATAFACGGGGGGGGGGTNPPPGNDEIALAIVEACGQSSAQLLIEVLDVLEPLFNPNSTKPTPSFFVDGADPGMGVIVWQLDLDGDMNPEVAGEIGFRDAGDQPVAPFDFGQLAQDLSNLAMLLSGAPDGTQVVVSFQGGGGNVSRTGQLETVYTGGMPGTLTGGFSFDDGGTGCAASFEFDAVALAAIAGAIPNATFNVVLGASDGSGEGVFSFDGTNSVTIALTIDAETFDFLLGLSDGSVTPQP